MIRIRKNPGLTEIKEKITDYRQRAVDSISKILCSRRMGSNPVRLDRSYKPV